MDEQLRKRLEEAAENYAESQDYIELENEVLMDEEGICIPKIYRGKQVEEGFFDGAEHGYKEAIAQAKEWLKDSEHFYQGGDERYPEVLSMFDTIQEMLADFEEAMNKLWEEKK